MSCIQTAAEVVASLVQIRDGPNVSLSHSAKAEGFHKLTERVPNIRQSSAECCNVC